MTTDQLEAKYLNKLAHFYPVDPRVDKAFNRRTDVYGKIDRITMEDAFDHPTVIFQMNRRRYEVDAEQFEEQIAVLL